MYWDMMAKINNAALAGKKSLKVPYTQLDFAVLEALQKRGFIKAAERKGKGYKRIISIILNPEEARIQGIKIVSTPARRIYKGYKDLHSVRQGFGISIVSTSRGVMTGEEARRAKVGGQILFEVW
jgi:small subunit ribosomal protein S8